MVEHTFNLSSQETEADRSLGVWGKPVLPSKSQVRQSHRVRLLCLQEREREHIIDDQAERVLPTERMPQKNRPKKQNADERDYRYIYSGTGSHDCGNQEILQSALCRLEPGEGGGMIQPESKGLRSRRANSGTEYVWRPGNPEVEITLASVTKGWMESQVFI